MPPEHSPSRVRRQLAAELAQLRRLAGLTTRDIAAKGGPSQPMVSRAEHGKTVPTQPQTEAWLAATNAPSDVRDRVLALLEAAHGEAVPWRDELADSPVAHLQYVARDRERASALLRSYQPTVIPGLLQTVDYARALLPLVAPGHDHEAAVAARLERQGVLYDSGKRFEFLLTSHALRWSPASPELMVAQRDRLAQLSGIESVTIRVVGDDAAPLPWSNFTIYEPSDLPPLVAIELDHGPVTVAGAEGIELYRNIFDRLGRTARPVSEVVRALEP